MRTTLILLIHCIVLFACESSGTLSKDITEKSTLNVSINSSVVSSLEIAKWRNDAVGAYSMIHDDLCADFNDGLFDIAGPLASHHGVVFGAGAIANACLQRGGDIWPKIQSLIDQGHEIISHSWDHGASVELGWTPLEWSVQEDVIASKRVLEENLPGLSVDFFIFPYDAYTDERLNELRKNGYLGARAGREMYRDRRVNTRFENFDPFRCEFDAYMSRFEQDMEFSKGIEYAVSIYDDENDDVDIQHAQAAIDTRGWSVQELHAVSDTIPTAWGAISIDNYTRLLTFLQNKQRDNSLWVDTPSNIVKYIQTKKYVEGVVINGQDVEFVLNEKADQRYETAVTLKLKLDSLSSVTQNGDAIEFRKNALGEYLVDASPFRGSLTLSYNKRG